MDSVTDWRKKDDRAQNFEFTFYVPFFSPFQSYFQPRHYNNILWHTSKVTLGDLRMENQCVMFKNSYFTMREVFKVIKLASAPSLRVHEFIIVLYPRLVKIKKGHFEFEVQRESSARAIDTIGFIFSHMYSARERWITSNART